MTAFKLTKGVTYKCMTLLAVALLQFGVAALPTTAAPPVVFWKGKKVGGTTMCQVMLAYARKNSLTIATSEDESSSWAFKPSETSPTTSSSGRRLSDSSKFKVVGCPSDKNRNGVDLLQTDVMCCHQVADEENSKNYDEFLQKPGLLQMFTVRDPTAQAVARYYYVHTHTDQLSCPTVSVAKHQFSIYVRRNMWFEYGSAWNRNHNALFNTHNATDSDNFVDDTLAQLNDPHAHRLTVFVFERFDESLILMLNQLNLTIDEGVPVTMKVRPHLKAEDWPKEATDYMAELVKERRLDQVYDRALEVFDHQVASYGADRMARAVAELQAARLRKFGY